MTHIRLAPIATIILCLVGLAYAALVPRTEVVFVSDRVCAGAGDVPARGELPAARAATLCLVNQERAGRGLAPLRPSLPLERAAQAHSEDMVRRQFFAHATPDGVKAGQRIEAVGYPPGAGWGENIAWGEETRATPAEIVRAWMQSPGHQANILDPEFREIGVGVAPGSPRYVPGSAATYTTDFGTAATR